MVKASQLEYALIGLIKQKAQSGYDLRKIFATTPMGHFSDSPGSIYPALRRLQSRGWIRALQEKGGRQRQLLRVTSEGTRAFVNWLKQPVTAGDVMWRMNELMLRFAFQGGNVPVSITREFLRQLERELAIHIRDLREYAKQPGLAKAVSTGALAFASGIEGYEAQLAWTKRAKKKFTEESS